jgi:hypothetical protein
MELRYFSDPCRDLGIILNKLSRLLFTDYISFCYAQKIEPYFSLPHKWNRVNDNTLMYLGAPTQFHNVNMYILMSGCLSTHDNLIS